MNLTKPELRFSINVSRSEKIVGLQNKEFQTC